MFNLTFILFHLKLGSAKEMVDDSLVGANELLYDLLKALKIDSLPIDGVHSEVFSDDVLGDNGGDFKEKAKVYKFL